MRNVFVLLAVASMLFLNACQTSPLIRAGNMTMRGTKAEASPPARVESVKALPSGKNAQSTYHYKVDIYPGLDENFDPNPRLTLAEYNQLVQLDWYCAKKVDELSGQFGEMSKQGLTYGAFQGVLGALGAKLAFGGVINAVDYLAYIGMTGLGGGLAGGKITYDAALNIAHGYCMTANVYKADELEGKLRRITITPILSGKAKLPEVSEVPAPMYKNNGGNGKSVPPPPPPR